jgi:hypothetical protein
MMKSSEPLNAQYQAAEDWWNNLPEEIQYDYIKAAYDQSPLAGVDAPLPVKR